MPQRATLPGHHTAFNIPRSRGAFVVSVGALVLLLLCASLLGGCGFKLRGTQHAPFHTLFLSSGGLDPNLEREIRTALTQEGQLTLVPQPDKADVIVYVSPLNRSKQILTLNAQGTVSQFTLYSRLNFRATDNAGNEILHPTDVSVSRLFNYNDVQILAKTTEEQVMVREMQHELVRQMLNRIVTLKPTVKAEP